MKSREATVEIEYPESDGKPMGETDLHRDWMFRIIELLKYRYRGQRVYVSGDLLVYYEEGNPARFVVPDALVVKHCDPGRRRVYKIWEEGKAPDVAFETTSSSTRREDTVFKPQVFARIGIREYFLYDPTADYLDPPLQGFRLAEDDYDAIEPDSSGALECRQLDLVLRLDSGQLVMIDRATGARLVTEAEAERAAKEIERAAKEAERAAKEAERAARQAAEAEVERLRRRLAERDAATKKEPPSR